MTSDVLGYFPFLNSVTYDFAFADERRY